jgi:hypothetical protein
MHYSHIAIGVVEVLVFVVVLLALGRCATM